MKLTYNELNRYFYIQKKIKCLNAEIAKISFLSSTANDGMPHGSGIGDPVYNTYIKIEKLTEKLNYQKQRAVDELDKLNDFIESIEDIEMQVILRLRFIKCWSYERIGDELFMNHSTVLRKLKHFLENSEDCTESTIDMSYTLK